MAVHVSRNNLKKNRICIQLGRAGGIYCIIRAHNLMPLMVTDEIEAGSIKVFMYLYNYIPMLCTSAHCILYTVHQDLWGFSQFANDNAFPESQGWVKEEGLFGAELTNNQYDCDYN